MSFSHDQYRQIIASIRRAGMQPVSVSDFLTAADKKRLAILRHDVDRRPAKAIALARLEHELGIRSTYYFRAGSRGTFPADAVRAIVSLGHEVGYHYETLSQCGGNVPAALAAFERNLAQFRQIAPCVTVSMHGAPLSRHDNQQLAAHIDFERLELLGDAVSHVVPFEPYYFTDTGGRWNASGRENLRDYAGVLPPPGVSPDNEAAFASLLSKNERPIYLSTHPERWSHTRTGYLYAAFLDQCSLAAKRGLHFLGRRHRT